MSELIKHDPSSGTAPKPEPTRGDLIVQIAWHVTAVIAWTYFIVKLFIFDIDIAIVQAIAPKYAWICYYKFIAIACIVSISFVFFDRIKIIGFLLFVAFYPIILFSFLLPRFIFKTRNWMFLVAIINAAVTAFTNFRVKFVLKSIALIAFVVIFVSYDWLPLAIGACVLVMINYIEYFAKIFSTFRPSSVMRVYNKIPDFESDFVKNQALSDQMRSLTIPSMTPGQLATYRSSLQMSLIANRFCLFSATVLRDYKRSGFPSLSGAITTLLLFIFTVIMFAAVNMALFKMDIDSFSYRSEEFPTWFTFFHYSFNTMVFATTRELTAVSTESYAANMGELSG